MSGWVTAQPMSQSSPQMRTGVEKLLARRTLPGELDRFLAAAEEEDETEVEVEDEVNVGVGVGELRFVREPKAGSVSPSSTGGRDGSGDWDFEARGAGTKYSLPML